MVGKNGVFLRLTCLLFSIGLVLFNGYAQTSAPTGIDFQKGLYRLDSIDHLSPAPFLSASFHRGRRQALRMLMPKHSVAVFFTSPERERTGDFNFTYAPDPNYYYLSGSIEPHGVLFVYSDSVVIDGIKTNELLVVQDKDPKSELWNGKKMGVDVAKSQLGFALVVSISRFLTFNLSDLFFKDLNNLYVQFPRDFDADSPDVVRGDNKLLGQLVEQFNKILSKQSRLVTESPRFFVNQLRAIKNPDEIALMKYCIGISALGHLNVFKNIHSGQFEYQAQALMEYQFKNHGAEYVAYASICGSGENSCTLHYDKNDRKMHDGDLLLMDCGAEYHGFCADITRTIPVNGHFSFEQLQIYNLVLAAQDAGIAACQPGRSFGDPRKAAQEVIAKGLIELGIIKKESDYFVYFMHGTSHFMGLEVHDVGQDLSSKLVAGHILTVEPGIYIPAGSPCDPKWWNIGIRIEDDILITETGHINLSGDLPRKPQEIELLMKR